MNKAQLMSLISHLPGDARGITILSKNSLELTFTSNQMLEAPARLLPNSRFYDNGHRYALNVQAKDLTVQGVNS